MGISKPYVIENGLDITSTTINLNGSAVSVNPDNSLSVNGVTLSTPDAINRAGLVWKQASFGIGGLVQGGGQDNRKWGDMTKSGPILFSLSDEQYGTDGYTGNLQYRYSLDGVTWAQSEFPNQTNSNADREHLPGLYDRNKWIAYGNGKWVNMLHQNPYYHSDRWVRTSTDGINWTTHTNTVPWAYSYPSRVGNDRGNLWYATIFDGTKFIALGGESYYQRPSVMNSDDGINWTQVSPRFVTVGNVETNDPTADSLYLHSDYTGDDPTVYRAGFHKWVDMASDGNVLVAMGEWQWAEPGTAPWQSDNVALSYDHGAHWTYVKTPIKANWDTVEYANGIFIAKGRHQTDPVLGTNIPVVIRSIDGGLTWTQCTLPTGSNNYFLQGLAYGDGQWAITRSGIYDTTGEILVSVDGAQTFKNVPTDPVIDLLFPESGLNQVFCAGVQYFNNRFIAAWGNGAAGNSTDMSLQVSGSTLNVDCCGITSYNDLTDKPTFKTINGNTIIGTGDITITGGSSFSGSYTDLTNKPTLFDGAYASLTGKPTLFSGAYADLTGKPNIPTVPTTLSSFTNDSGFITGYTETDPIYTASTWHSTSNNSSNWNTAYGWGDHSTKGYLTNVDWIAITGKPTFATVATSGSYTDLSNKPSIPTVPTNVSSFANDSGYLTSYTETDPIYTASSWYTTTNNRSNWDAAYGWGNHASAGYLTSFSETDTLQSVTTRGATTTNNITVGDLHTTGNLQIDGNLTVNGTQNIIDTTNLAVEDNMIYLNEGSTVTNPDLGFAGNYNDGTYQHAGLFRDASDGKWKFYHQYIPEPDISIDITHASFALADVQANSFIGSLTGNADTVTNGLYSNGSYSDPTWLTGLAYSKLTGSPTLATVATSGSYADLTGKPTLFSGVYADLTSKPTFATIATTGAYADLSGLPTLFSGAYADLTGKPTLFSGNYADLAGKPTLFDGAYTSLTGAPTLATVATSGSYNDLSSLPTIPTNTNQLTNGSGYITGITSANVTTALGFTPIQLSSLSIAATAPAAGSGALAYNAGVFTYTPPAISTLLSAGTSSVNLQIASLGVGVAFSGVSGEIRAGNNITAYYSSDARLKENIKDVDNALDKVCAIGSKTFDWTDDYIAEHGGEDGYFVQKSDFGVIAQDVQEVFPQAVRTREDGTLAVDYEKLSTLAFGAIKELVKRIEALESK